MTKLEASSSVDMIGNVGPKGQVTKWVGLAAGIWVQALAGNGNVFAHYSTALKNVLQINQVQLNNLGVAKDFGENVGLLAGGLCNLLPTWVILLIGALECFFGYGIVWLVMSEHIAPLPYWQVIFIPLSRIACRDASPDFFCCFVSSASPILTVRFLQRLLSSGPLRVSYYCPHMIDCPHRVVMHTPGTHHWHGFPRGQLSSAQGLQRFACLRPRARVAVFFTVLPQISV